MTPTIKALRSIAETLEDHPAYMGEGLTAEDFVREGGDAATVTELAYEARAALAAHDAEQAAQAVPADLYVGLIERLMKLSTRLGIANGDSVEHFAVSLEDRLYAICRCTESLLDSLAPAAPAPEAQPADKWGAFGYLRKTNSKDHPPHGWSFHFCGKPGDVPVWTTPLKAEAQAAGQDERAAFDKWFQDFRHGWKSEKDVAFDAWQARAALAQHPNLSDRAVQKRLAAQWGYELAQRQPLTDEQIESIRAQVFSKALQRRDGCDDQTWDHWFARAIEHAHGIGAPLWWHR